MPRPPGRWALTGHGPLTISRVFTHVPRLIRRVVNLAPVREGDAPYRLRRGPRAVLPGAQRVAARHGWAVETASVYNILRWTMRYPLTSAKPTCTSCTLCGIATASHSA